MTDRYIITSDTGQPVIRTSSLLEAEHFHRLAPSGEIIDTLEMAA